VVERYHFVVDDVLVRAVAVEIAPTYAEIRYMLNLPALSSLSGSVYTAWAEHDVLIVDLGNREMILVVRVDPDTAVQAIEMWKRVAKEYSRVEA